MPQPAEVQCSNIVHSDDYLGQYELVIRQLRFGTSTKTASSYFTPIHEDLPSLSHRETLWMIAPGRLQVEEGPCWGCLPAWVVPLRLQGFAYE